MARKQFVRRSTRLLRQRKLLELSRTCGPVGASLAVACVAVNHYDPALAATTGLVNIKGYNGNFTDCEDYCVENQPDWINGSANAADWGDPGMRHATNDRYDD